MKEEKYQEQEASSTQENTTNGQEDGIKDNEEAVEMEKSPIEKLEKEIEDLNQRILRISADFDNFRKRTRAEKEEFFKYANANLICDLLPVIDNFQRALEVKEPSAEIKGFLTGFEMIYRQLNQVLTQAGLEPIPAVGSDFDPQKHEAVMQVAESSVEDNIIIEELRTGYILKDKVLRPTMVKVAKNT